MDQTTRRSVLAGLGAAGLAGAAGCIGDSGGDGDTRTIGMSQHAVGGSWITAFLEAGELYAEQQGYTLETQTHDEDASQQISQVRQMINQEYDGIVLAPWDQQLNGVIEEAIDAGIPVFTVNSDATTDAIKSFTAFGNYEAGVKCADEMYAALEEQKPDVGTYEVLNVRGDFTGTSNARTNGFVDTMDEHDDVEIVETVQTTWARDDALSKVRSWLNANDPPHGAYSSNMTSGLGTYAAFNQQDLIYEIGHEDHVVITQLDGGPDVNPKIGNRYIDAAVDQPNYFYIPLAIKQMEAWWEDGDDSLPEPGTELTSDDYSFESVDHLGVDLFSEPIWEPAPVVEKDGHPHVRTAGITITEENADAPYLWGNIWGQDED